MAFPVVESFTPTIFSTSATAHLVAMPATVNVGDLLIVMFTNNNATAATVATPGAWNQLHTTASATVRYGTYYKIADGTEDGTTVDFVTSVSRKAVAHTYRISTWHGTTPPRGWNCDRQRCARSWNRT